MKELVVELPTSADEWSSFDGAALDDKVRELDGAGRSIEAGSSVRPSMSTRPTSSPTGIARSATG